MNLKVLAEASLNGITKDMHLHHGSVNGKHGKVTTPSWDSSLPFPSMYFFKLHVVHVLVWRSLDFPSQSL
jgi:hypothetical protein